MPYKVRAPKTPTDHWRHRQLLSPSAGHCLYPHASAPPLQLLLLVSAFRFRCTLLSISIYLAGLPSRHIRCEELHNPHVWMIKQ